MSTPRSIDLGTPALLEFRGPDAVRFLNGQMTQDVRLVAGGSQALPACITDAKGKLQFRVWLHARDTAILIEGPQGLADEIEARLTRYLIADEVETKDLSHQWRLVHLIGPLPEAPEGVMVRTAQRFGVEGADWWIPAGLDLKLPPALEAEELESLRIQRGVPAWGRELTPGMLPPEAGLDASDISYHKGCYIGQEVISRIKSAGKVNRRLQKLRFSSALPIDGLQLIDAEGREAGEITSIAPLADGDARHALAFVKRGAESLQLLSADGGRHPLTTDRI